MTKAEPSAIPFRINQRPCGDFAVQRFINGVTQRWGVYPTRERANMALRIANVGAQFNPVGARVGQ